MTLPNLFLLAARQLFRRRRSTAAVLLTLATGFAGVLFFEGLIEGLLVRIRDADIESNTGHLQVRAAGGFDDAFTDDLIAEADNLAADIARLPGVERVQTRLPFGALLSDGEHSFSVGAAGVTDYGSKNVPSTSVTYVSGRALSSDDHGDIVIGSELAQAMNVGPGASLILVCRTRDESWNGRDVTVRGVFTTGLRDLDSVLVGLRGSSAAELVRADGGVQSIVIHLDRTENTVGVAALLRNGTLAGHPEIEMRTWDQMSDYHAKTASMMRQWAIALRAVLFLLVMIGVHNTVGLSVAQRTVEIGTLRALGLRRKTVALLFIHEGLLMGLAGALAGVALSCAISAALAVKGLPMPPLPGYSMSWTVNPDFPSLSALETGALILFGSIMAALLPALRAARIAPATALRSAT